MCGIAGFQSERPAARRLLVAMNDALRHRGPDDEGVWMVGQESDDGWSSSSGTTGLAQRRLSIIDLSSAGRNPMRGTGGRQWITYNGEVYNFRDLRKELEEHGHRFRSQTDTEVVLGAYQQWGVDCLGRLAGMFAFAIWDPGPRRLFLARDRLGKKPLYYGEYAGRFAFASELKALLADPDFPRDIDPEALNLYLRYGYVPAPWSIFRAARKLLPAHYAIWQDGTLTVRRYWDPVSIASETPLDATAAEAEGLLEKRLQDAVAGRMIADVPVGAFLSGGVDSSLVVALMQEQSTAPVQTFTIRFENPEYNEADHAAAVAKYLRTEHHEETCSERQMLETTEILPEIFDEPFADPSAVPTYLVSRMTRQRVKVALSGDGGDELFVGYPRYGAFERTNWLLRSPRLVRYAAGSVLERVPRRRYRRAASILRQADPDGYSRFVNVWDPGEIAQIAGARGAENPIYLAAREGTRNLPEPHRPPVLDLVSYLPEDILTKVDRCSMAVSLETRCPILDHRVVELALRLPFRLKRQHGVSKWVLKRLLYRKVPRELVDRPKMGFGVPLPDWFRGPLRERMDEGLKSSRLEELGLDPALPREVWSEFLAGKSHRPELLWSLFALLSWKARWSEQPRVSLPLVESLSSATAALSADR